MALCLFVCLFVWFVCLDTESKSTCSSMAKKSSNLSDFKYAPCLFACSFVCLFDILMPHPTMIAYMTKLISGHFVQCVLALRQWPKACLSLP